MNEMKRKLWTNQVEESFIDKFNLPHTRYVQSWSHETVLFMSFKNVYTSLTREGLRCDTCDVANTGVI